MHSTIGGTTLRWMSRAAYLLIALFLLAGAAAWAAPSRAAATPARTTAAGIAPTVHGAEGSPPVVLAADDGLSLIGRVSALHGRPAPRLSDLSRSEASAFAALPAGNVFFRGATCRWPWRFRSRVLLTFALPKALFAHTSLPLYRLTGGDWARLKVRAVVGDVNTTATAAIGRPGRYAVCLTRAWRTTELDGYRLVQYSGTFPRTSLADPVVLAEGPTTDPAVIQAIMDATGGSEASARKTLVSYDSTRTPVTVLRLTAATPLLRCWSGTSTVGRWFSPSDGRTLPSPSRARAFYALPDGNLALDLTLHLVRSGTSLIDGDCADMTAQPGYGPWATGGGPQLFGPRVSTYPPPAYDPSRIEVLADLRWEAGETDAIVW